MFFRTAMITGGTDWDKPILFPLLPYFVFNQATNTSAPLFGVRLCCAINQCSASFTSQKRTKT